MFSTFSTSPAGRAGVAFGWLAACWPMAGGQDWNTVPVLRHRDYQAVNADGSSAYGGGFPLRLIGVVINHTEDWLDPTPAYDPGVHPWVMGGQAEFYVQAVNLDGTAWDPAPGSPFDDFGGTACWMGQNYGNHGWHYDPAFSYTDSEWTAELGRLGLFGGDGVVEPLRAGDLVEVRARGGLPYQGKMNVNEEHDKEPDHDFELVVLRRGFGQPAPTPLLLSDMKNAANQFLPLDATRQTGGERHQAILVRLLNVQVSAPTNWSANTDITVTDGVRTLVVHLGLNPSFDGAARFAPGVPFDVIGVLDQASFTNIGGYRLLAMNAQEAQAAPDSLALAVMAGQTVVRWPQAAGGEGSLRFSATMEAGDWHAAGTAEQSSGVMTHREAWVTGMRFFKLQP